MQQALRSLETATNSHSPSFSPALTVIADKLPSSPGTCYTPRQRQDKLPLLYSNRREIKMEQGRSKSCWKLSVTDSVKLFVVVPTWQGARHNTLPAPCQLPASIPFPTTSLPPASVCPCSCLCSLCRSRSLFQRSRETVRPAT